LDLHTPAGTFLGYTATDKNIIYLDENTKRIKTATHCNFDKAMMTIPRAQLSPAMIALQDLGYCGDLINDAMPTPPISSSMSANIHSPTSPASDTPASEFYIKTLSIHATIPSRATDGSIGYDLFSARDTIISPHAACQAPN
jgi:hypothetical protein